MTISQGLKEKNRSTGRISALQGQIRKYNVYRKDRPVDYSAKVLLIELQTEWAFLINLKGKLAKANVGVAENLIALTEAKAELKFWNDLIPYTAAAETVTQEAVRYGSDENVEVTTISEITSKEVVENVKMVQAKIDNLQDEIDAYNATTQI